MTILHIRNSFLMFIIKNYQNPMRIPWEVQIQQQQQQNNVNLAKQNKN